MSDQKYKYVIVGAGLGGASAVDGIRELDKEGSILIVGSESHLPYARPPLSKKLWVGQKEVEDIFIHDLAFYSADSNLDLVLESTITNLDASAKTVTDSQGNTYSYEKLLLATGGVPRMLNIPGGDLDSIYYYRYLDDFLRLKPDVQDEKPAVIIGGGFIGSEMAAALSVNKVEVTMIFPEPYLVSRVFPESLGMAIQEEYHKRGIRILAGDVPVSIEKNGEEFITRTKNGEEIESGIVIVGAGIMPSVELAEAAGLIIGNGVTVNEYLQTSDPDIYAVGDSAFFPYYVLGEQVRIEHWDNALSQGKLAGRNMAGATEPFTYMPYFFSDLFDFGYEAVGDVNSSLETFMDWEKENETGVIYYLKEGKVRGAMLCNVWGKLDAARELIKKGEQVTPEDLRGVIRS